MVNKKILGLIFTGALIALVVGVVYIWRPGSNPYVNGHTAYMAMSQENPNFFSGNAYLQQKNYLLAQQQYEKALAAAKDPTQRNLATFYIALTHERTGDHAHAIQLYKQIAAAPSGYGRAEAVQEMGEMYYNYPKVSDMIASETFKDAPYSGFMSGTSTALAYRKLYEYAVNFYPLGLSEARVAYWYAADAAANQHSGADARITTDVQIAQQSIEKADADIERNIKNNSREQAFHPLTYVLEGSALKMLASVGVGSAADANTRFQKAIVALSGRKVAMVRLAKQNADFKTYLISVGWHEADFK